MILYIDGGCSGNGQRDLSRRQMVAVVTDAVGTVLSERAYVGGSNNIAELLAVRDALVWCVTQGLSAVELRTDSRNNFAWVLGKRVGLRLNDRDRVLEIRGAIQQLRQSISLTLVWVGRDENPAGHYLEGRGANADE